MTQVDKMEARQRTQNWVQYVGKMFKLSLSKKKNYAVGYQQNSGCDKKFYTSIHVMESWKQFKTI